MLSLLAMLEGLLTRLLRLKYLFLLAALLLELGYLFVHDGLIAWEVMRWTLILILAARSSTSIRTALRLSISRMLPFVVAAVGLILWRAQCLISPGTQSPAGPPAVRERPFP
jgi:hypothetical protein